MAAGIAVLSVATVAGAGNPSPLPASLAKPRQHVLFRLPTSARPRPSSSARLGNGCRHFPVSRTARQVRRSERRICSGVICMDRGSARMSSLQRMMSCWAVAADNVELASSRGNRGTLGPMICCSRAMPRERASCKLARPLCGVGRLVLVTGEMAARGRTSVTALSARRSRVNCRLVPQEGAAGGESVGVNR